MPSTQETTSGPSSITPMSAGVADSLDGASDPHRRDLVIALVLFALAFIQNLALVDAVPIHGDEARWVNRGHYLRDLFDPFGSTWDDKFATRDQPPLGAYLMGLGLLVQGRDLEPIGVWDFRFDYEWNEANGRMIATADRNAGRRTNALVGAMAVMVVYFLARRLSNRVGGVVAGVFLLIHPLMTLVSIMAWSDALMALLLALAALAACRLADRPTWGRAVVLGVVLGLGGATKLSPLLLTLPLAGIGAVLIVDGGRRSLIASRRLRDRSSSPTRPDAHPRRRLGWMLVTLPLISYATFVAVYPYLWPNPVARTVNLFAFRQAHMLRYEVNWPTLAVDNPIEAVRFVWSTLGSQLTAGGRLTWGVEDRWEIVPYLNRLDLGVAMVGAVLLAIYAVRCGLTGRYTLVLAVLGGQVALILMGMRVSLIRYHTPIVIALAPCIGVAVGHSGLMLGNLLRWSRERARRVIDPQMALPQQVQQ